MVLAAMAAAAAQNAPASPPEKMPRIGLALSGGGARGLAHVGVLKVLEEMRIPISCVTGTSMGAIVGGTFAAGRSPAQMEKLVLAADWDAIFRDKPPRKEIALRRKVDDYKTLFAPEFGVTDDGLALPKGVIAGVSIESFFRTLATPAFAITDFNKLPIPFRAMATDIETGESVVLDHGSLAQAMRASMSVPGVFAPVNVDGRVLGDGGLSRNVPVDVARETCADVVIAVAVPNPVPTLDDLQSPLTQVSRTIDVLIGANEKQQLDTLGPQDVAIIVPMGDIGSASFDKVADAIPLGRAAALGQRNALARYALPEDQYRAWRAAVSRATTGEMRLASVSFTGLERVNESYVREMFGLVPGAVVNEKQVARRVNDLFALGDFETVRYALRGDAETPDLEVSLKEKSWGPNFVRFDLGLYMGTSGNTAFTLAGDVLRTWVNDLGGELHGSMRLGRTTGATASLYQPLDTTHRWFVEPGLQAQTSLEDLYLDGDAVARYDLSEVWGSLDAGRVFGSTAELRAGIRSGWQWADREIAFPELPEISAEGYGGWAMRFTYDSRDRELLGRNGMLVRANYFRSEEALGAELEYERAEAMATYALPVRENFAYVRGAGGSSFGTSLPIYDMFVLGGPVSFPGLNIGELRGDSYWSAQAGYLHRIAEISSLFGQALYAGAAFTAGRMYDRLDEIDGTIYSGALILSGRTPLGPLGLSLAYSSVNEWQIVFGLGRPIEEGAITDPTW
jgi:NTE family protein